MKIFKLSFISSIFIMCILLPVVGTTAIKKESFKYEKGLLSLDVKHAPIKDVLSVISNMAGVEIYIFNDAVDKTVTVKFEGRSLYDSLRTILKGSSYAIVFLNDKGESNVHWAKSISSGRTRTKRPAGGKSTGSISASSKASNSGRTASVKNISSNQYADNENYLENGIHADAENWPEWYYDGISLKEAMIQNKIDKLEEEIESGYADLHYDHWVAIKGEKYIRHASDLIEEHKEQLNNL